MLLYLRLCLSVFRLLSRLPRTCRNNKMKESDIQRLIERTTKSLCGCYYCTKERDVFETFSRMIVCPVCGNKRCPKATDHNYECTGSNEPGQKGSRYLI